MPPPSPLSSFLQSRGVFPSGWGLWLDAATVTAMAPRKIPFGTATPLVPSCYESLPGNRTILGGVLLQNRQSWVRIQGSDSRGSDVFRPFAVAQGLWPCSKWKREPSHRHSSWEAMLPWEVSSVPLAISGHASGPRSSLSRCRLPSLCAPMTHPLRSLDRQGGNTGPAVQRWQKALQHAGKFFDLSEEDKKEVRRPAAPPRRPLPPPLLEEPTL